MNAVALNSGWDVAAVGDFTKDGKADILWRNYTTGANGYWEMNGVSLVSLHHQRIAYRLLVQIVAMLHST